MPRRTFLSEICPQFESKESAELSLPQLEGLENCNGSLNCIRICQTAFVPKERPENHPNRPRDAVVTSAASIPSSVRERIEKLFLDNIGRVVTREQIVEVAGSHVENWHQRLSELRTDSGYTILSHRDAPYLAPSEYVMPNSDKREKSGKRVMPSVGTWKQVLANANGRCQWSEDGTTCALRDGDTDPIGGGKVKLTADHLTPHEMRPDSDPMDPGAWRALCARHQVMKKNFWDNATGKMNYVAIVQAAPKGVKREILDMLLTFFGLRAGPKDM